MKYYIAKCEPRKGSFIMKIIIDSTTDLPEQVLKEYNIDLLPLRVYLENEEYEDKVSVSVDEVYDTMRKGIAPITSLPNPSRTYELFKKYASQGIDFIFYSFSSKMSSTYENAYLIIQELKKEYTDVKMEVVDTKGGSFASGLIALQGALLSKIGVGFRDILEISKMNVKNIEHIFTIDDLSWLLKGGRISKSSEIIGKALNIKPILYVDDGEMIVINKVRGRKKALKTVVDLTEERIEKFPNQIIGITHADDLNAALKVKEMISQRIGNDNILIEKIGGVLGSHLGIGGVGVFFLNDEPKLYINEI